MARDDMVVGGIHFGPSTGPDVKGIRPKRPYQFPVSRDHQLSIECAVSECPAHRNNKCTMPSCIVIGSDGRCLLGVKSRKGEVK